MSLSSIRKNSPSDFPLRVFVRNGNNVQLVAKLPNSIWVPRIGERLIIPILDEFSKTVGSRTLKVQDVTYDLVDDGVYITCENVSVSPKKPTSISALFAIDRLEAVEAAAVECGSFDDQLAALKASLTSENQPPYQSKSLHREEMENLKRELDQL